MIPLEDNFADIIGKAQRGLGLSDTQLAEKARVNSQTVRKLRAGEFDELTVLRIAPVLGLAARALCELATGSWRPPKMEEIEGHALLRHGGEFVSGVGPVEPGSGRGRHWRGLHRHAKAGDERKFEHQPYFAYTCSFRSCG